ncbi:hypothetical protein COH76_08805 [Neisseria meningitidis]|nr:hypothetical protein COH76_08805 [Neisseria meningitidis]RQL39547.1 hypothetical protein COH25_09280 [Neisseria meningitidis]
MISIICKGKDNYFPVRNKPILLNILKPSTPINTILKHCQKKLTYKQYGKDFSAKHQTRDNVS